MSTFPQQTRNECFGFCIVATIICYSLHVMHVPIYLWMACKALRPLFIFFHFEPLPLEGKGGVMHTLIGVVGP
jgi:hypothetical protein